MNNFKFNRAFWALLPVLLVGCGGDSYTSKTASLTIYPLPAEVYARTLTIRGEVKSPNSSEAKVNLTVGGQTFSATVKNGVYEGLVTLQAGKNEIVASLSNEVTVKTSTHYGSTLAAGAAHSGAIKNGKLHMWGKNNLGQAGNGHLSVGELPFNLVNSAEFVALSFNANYSLGIDKDGKVHAWGDGSQGQMGKQPETLQECYKDRFGTPSFCQKTPEIVAGLENIVQVQAAGGHVLALGRDGEVYAWGENAYGQVSAGAPEMVVSPLKLSLSDKMIALAGQGQTSYALGENGKVYAWGDNEVGQLGQGDLSPHAAVVVVNLPQKAVQIAAGGSHAVALLENGDIYAWGENFQNQVGPKNPNKAETEEPLPKKVATAAKVKQVLAGGNTSGFITEAGEIFIWGLYSDEMEDLGSVNVPVSKELEEPTKVLSNFKADRFVFGAMHQVAESEGKVFAWGWNTNRSLGNDTFIDNWMQPLPSEISLP